MSSTAPRAASANSAQESPLHPRARWIPVIFWFHLACEVLIVITGGLVRLTGSGLGCPTWPECTPGSFVPTIEQEEGIHKFIEFGNRTLTGLVGFAAVACLIALWRWAPHRRRLMILAWLSIGGVAAQALVGGITVLTSLHPIAVAFHFLQSMVLIMLAMALVIGWRETDAAPRHLVPEPVRHLALLTVVVGTTVMVLGTVVTGSGPHSGDAEEPARFGFDPRTISWLHADAVMLFVGLVLGILVAVHLVTKDGSAPRRAWMWLFGVTMAQGAIGYTQYLTGLPEVLVLLHMAGACALTIALTNAWLSLRVRD